MDNITKLLIEIKVLLDEEENRIKRENSKFRFQFSSGLLNDVANVLEIHGFGAARTFLLDKLTKGKDVNENKILMRILDKLEKCPEIRLRRAIGRNIIKSLITLRKVEVSKNDN